jgi:hypothetical protein
MTKSSWRRSEKALKGASKYGKSSTTDVLFTPIITTFASSMDSARLTKTPMLFAILPMAPFWPQDPMINASQSGKNVKIAWQSIVPRKSSAGHPKEG